MLPVIFGLSGEAITPAERSFFKAADPVGFILFGRNIRDPQQVRALTGELRALSGRSELPILIDQEGGRVARLRPPHWPLFPAAGQFHPLYGVAPASALAAARSNALCLAATLRDVGINVNCAPMLDLLHAGCHDIVGDRSFGADPRQVAALGRSMLDGFAAGGIAGVIKHMPGHGRATADSHVELPRVAAGAESLEADMLPFAALAAQASMAMTAHVVYTAWDADLPATLSPTVIRDIIRGRIGFDGLLMTDDIEMHALDGPVPTRASAALAAGCDVVLHCSGDFNAMTAVAEQIGAISDAAARRLDHALGSADVPSDVSATEAAAHRDALLALAA